jgi:toxin ParE1/3/4
MAIVRRHRFLADFRDIIAYLEADDPDVAIRLINRVEETVQVLERMPGIGDLAPFTDPRYRGIRRSTVRQFRKHVIYYREIPDGIELLRLLHGARDIRRIFGDDD